MELLFIVVGIIIISLVSAQWGYRGGVKETERRWHDAVARKEDRDYWEGI